MNKFLSVMELLERKTLLTSNAFDGPLSSGGYEVLTERVTENESNFFVYQDGDSGLNHGFPSGKFAEPEPEPRRRELIDLIHIDGDCVDDSRSATGCSEDTHVLDQVRGTVLRIQFPDLSVNANDNEFVGVNFDDPENLGTGGQGEGYDLTGATKILYEARSVGGPLTAKFESLGSTKFEDLTTNWKRFEIDLPDSGLTDVNTLFSVSIQESTVPNGGTVLLDNIRFDPVPDNPTKHSEGKRLSLPRANDTFGVVSAVVASADDQAAVLDSESEWIHVSDQAAFNGGFRRKSVGGGTATFTIEDLEPRLYNIQTTWVANAANTTSARFEIFDGESSEQVVLLDQTEVSGDANDDGIADGVPQFGGVFWTDLGDQPVEVSSGTLKVVLSDSTNARVIADAIRIVPVIPPDQALRNLTTVYESALTAFALIDRGTNSDLDNAKLVLDTLLYVQRNDNTAGGGEFPTGPNGERSFRDAYSSGEIAWFNDQKGTDTAKAGEARLAGFSSDENLCTGGFCLVLDGGFGGNAAFGIMALMHGFFEFENDEYLDGALEAGNWIYENLADPNGPAFPTNHAPGDETFGGYFLGYPDQGVTKDRVDDLVTGKSVENNADIFAAFSMLATAERARGNVAAADEWNRRANIAGDYVVSLYDPGDPNNNRDGHFHTGSVPISTMDGPGIQKATESALIKGGEAVNKALLLDSNTFTTLALARHPRYREFLDNQDQKIDWREPVRFVLDTFQQQIAATAGGVVRQYEGFSISQDPTTGPFRPGGPVEGLAKGIAWEFTAQVVGTANFVDQMYGTSEFSEHADRYLQQLMQAQDSAPYGDGRGLVGATLDEENDAADMGFAPLDQCLGTPFQCIAERVGLAATAWGIFAETGANIFVADLPLPQKVGEEFLVDDFDNKVTLTDLGHNYFGGNTGAISSPPPGPDQFGIPITAEAITQQDIVIRDADKNDYSMELDIDFRRSRIPLVAVSALTNSPQFAWTQIDAVGTYDFQIRDAQTLIQIVSHQGITDTSFQVAAALPPAGYEVFVRFVDNATGAHPWSEAVAFEITNQTAGTEGTPQAPGGFAGFFTSLLGLTDTKAVFQPGQPEPDKTTSFPGFALDFDNFYGDFLPMAGRTIDEIAFDVRLGSGSEDFTLKIELRDESRFDVFTRRDVDSEDWTSIVLTREELNQTLDESSDVSGFNWNEVSGLNLIVEQRVDNPEPEPDIANPTTGRLLVDRIRLIDSDGDYPDLPGAALETAGELNPAYENAFLDHVRATSSLYFLDFASFDRDLPDLRGIIQDRSNFADLLTVGGAGFQLTSYVIDADRGYVDRDIAADRVHSALRLLAEKPQGPEASETIGHNGFFYHFLGADHLRKQNFDFPATTDVDESLNTVELSTIDTALAVAGVITAGQYFDGDSQVEQDIRRFANQIYSAVNWNFMFDATSNQFYLGWKPTEDRLDGGPFGRFLIDDADGAGQYSSKPGGGGEIPATIDFFTDEGLLIALLAMAAPNPEFRVSSDAWYAMIRHDDNGLIKTFPGALFTYQFFSAWVDTDKIGPDNPPPAAEGETQIPAIDYFENTRLAIQRTIDYATQNPLGHATLNGNRWGLNATEGPNDSYFAEAAYAASIDQHGPSRGVGEDINLQAEDFLAPIETPTRDNAEGEKTSRFTQAGQTDSTTTLLPGHFRYLVEVGYSNDEDPNLLPQNRIPDVVTILIDGNEVGQFTSTNTRPAGGEAGSGWNEFQTATVGFEIVTGGQHTVTVRIDSTDEHGIEIDYIQLQYETLQAENFQSPPETQTRSNAEGHSTSYFTQTGQSDSATTVLLGPARYLVEVRYSNDEDPNLSPEQRIPDVVTILVNGQEIGQFATVNTRPDGGGGGSGWNEFQTAFVGVNTFETGQHTVTIRVDETDEHGVEIDSVALRYGAIEVGTVTNYGVGSSVRHVPGRSTAALWHNAVYEDLNEDALIGGQPGVLHPRFGFADSFNVDISDAFPVEVPTGPGTQLFRTDGPWANYTGFSIDHGPMAILIDNYLNDDFVPSLFMSHPQVNLVLSDLFPEFKPEPGLRIVQSEGHTSVVEGTGLDTFTVSLTAQPDNDVIVDLAESDDSEISASPPTLTFSTSNWNQPQTVSITAVDDNIVEAAAENYQMHVSVDVANSDPAFGPVADQSIPVVVTDNDTATFIIEDITSNEADGAATFTVSLSNQIDLDVILDVVYLTNTASAADFDSVTDSITFPAGTTSVQTATVGIINDDIVEQDEQFTAALAVNAATDPGARSLDVTDTATGTIIDNDAGLLGDVDGNLKFDANDSFLIHLVKLAGTNNQIEQSNGPSSLSATQIRDNVERLNLVGDVDGDQDFDANDSFLIHLVKLAGNDTQIDEAKGTSIESASQIRANIDALENIATPASVSTTQRLATRRVDLVGTRSGMEYDALFSGAQPSSLQTSQEFGNVDQSGHDTVEMWEEFRSWIDAL